MPTKFLTLLSFICLSLTAVAQPRSSDTADWLIDASPFKAELHASSAAPKRYTLENGIVSRTFLLDSPVAATIGLTTRNKNVFRSVQPEAVVTIDGVRHEVGGLTGQPNHAYLRDEWLDTMQPAPTAMRFVRHAIEKTVERFPWKRTRHHAPNAAWPPPGIQLSLEFQPPPAAEDIAPPEFRVVVHYELYDNVPVFCKWLTIENLSDHDIVVDRVASELLSLVEHDSRVETREGVSIPRPDYLHVETDFAFGGFIAANANRHVVHWRGDPNYSTQVNYERKTPCLLVVEPTNGPDQTLKPKQTFTSARAFELLYDSTERERRSLTLRKMYRTIAPWVTENPLMHHMRVARPEAVRQAIDDAAEVGFEMVILSFGSGFNIENDATEYINQWREIGEYARNQNVEIGGYSLLSSRRIGSGNDIVSPPGTKPTHGNCPALTSEWGQSYYKKLYRFFEATGFTLLEHDGPYPGDVDVTARPPLQKGESDSRWVQGEIANRFYRWCRAQGIYVNAPDFYFLNGTNKCGMGYREVNWSLPRSMQLIHTRQNIFDGTWHKTPSMGWMFVPLSEYHGGGAAATIEPLDKHLPHYEQMIQANLGAGVQACFRGPRLFDAERTREMLKRNVRWFKEYRDILESDVIHGRRADGRDLDWILHVNPQLERKGMLLVYNPTDQPITKTIRVNLYYTGLKDKAGVSEKDRSAETLQLTRDYFVHVKVTVAPNGMNWFVIR
ncbi:alpha-galactosidase [Planctomycetota bacterium]